MNRNWLDALYRRRYAKPVWVASFLLMSAGIAWFVLSPSTLSYWLGGSLSLPAIFMVGGRVERKGFKTTDLGDPGGMSGPWSGP
jgi:hypothetical protein